MKIRTIKHIIKEGLVNAYRNKLMSLASIGIVAASMVIFGVFLLLSLNLSHNTNALKDQPEMEVFCNPDLDDTQVKQVEEAIKNNNKILQYNIVTKQEAMEKVKKILGNKENLLEGENESFLPVSFIIKLKDPQQSSEIVEEFKKVNGVENVRYSQSTIEFLAGAVYWIRLISGLLILILLAISMFIISNTIRLTVFARRKEINIMKYIGATDWFIRWPFVIEGVIIGLIGSVAAFIIIGYGYSAVESKVNAELVRLSINFIKFIKVSDIGLQAIGIYSLIGVAVGALGSFMSIRKYLRV